MGVLRKVFNQTFWQLLAKALNALVTVIALGFITRTYGPSGVGVNTLALTYLAFFYLAADLGLNGHIISKLHLKANEANNLFNSRLYWSIFLIVLSIALLPFLPFGGAAFKYSVMLASGSIMLSGIFNSTNLIFQYNHAYKFSAFASIGNGLIYLPVILALVWFKLPVEFLVLAPLSGSFSTAVLSLVLVRRYYKFKLTWVGFKYIAEVLKEAWPVTATMVINTVYFRVDTFILSAFRSISEVGNYNLAYQVFQDGIVIPTFIMNGYYPVMLKAFREDHRVFLKQFRLAVFVMFGLGVLAAILGWIFSPLVISILTGGGFEGSVVSLRILSLSFPAFFLSALLIWTLIVFKKYKNMMWIYTAGFVFNFSANLTFIPEASFVGAAWVTVLSEYLILVLQMVILFPELKKLHASNN